MFSKLPSYVLFVLVLAGGLRVWAGDTIPKVSISGRVLGASNKHTIIIMLWDSTCFMKKPVQQLRQPPAGEHLFSFRVVPGRWAICAFEDLNENGKVDIGLFGPKEPVAFWRTFHAMRKPRFDDAALSVDSTVLHVDIKLR